MTDIQELKSSASFEIWQDGMCVAGTSGPREAAYRDALHYLAVYGQDGPAQLREAGKRKAIAQSTKEQG